MVWNLFQVILPKAQKRPNQKSLLDKKKRALHLHGKTVNYYQVPHPNRNKKKLCDIVVLIKSASVSSYLVKEACVPLVDATKHRK